MYLSASRFCIPHRVHWTVLSWGGGGSWLSVLDWRPRAVLGFNESCCLPPSVNRKSIGLHATTGWFIRIQVDYIHLTKTLVPSSRTSFKKVKKLGNVLFKVLVPVRRRDWIYTWLDERIYSWARSFSRAVQCCTLGPALLDPPQAVISYSVSPAGEDLNEYPHVPRNHVLKKVFVAVQVHSPGVTFVGSNGVSISSLSETISGRSLVKYFLHIAFFSLIGE